MFNLASPMLHVALLITLPNTQLQLGNSIDIHDIEHNTIYPLRVHMQVLAWGQPLAYLQRSSTYQHVNF